MAGLRLAVLKCHNNKFFINTKRNFFRLRFFLENRISTLTCPTYSASVALFGAKIFDFLNIVKI